MRDPVFLNCSECSFWRPVEGSPAENPFRECRRGPPAAGGVLEPSLCNPYAAAWPITSATQGCASGELRARTPEELQAMRPVPADWPEALTKKCHACGRTAFTRSGGEWICEPRFHGRPCAIRP